MKIWKLLTISIFSIIAFLSISISVSAYSKEISYSTNGYSYQDVLEDALTVLSNNNYSPTDIFVISNGSTSKTNVKFTVQFVRNFEGSFTDTYNLYWAGGSNNAYASTSVFSNYYVSLYYSAPNTLTSSSISVIRNSGFAAFNWGTSSSPYFPIFSNYFKFYYNGVQQGAYEDLSSSPDTFYIGSQGFNIKYAVVPNADSIKHGWWYETNRYQLQFTLQYQGSPLSFSVPNYLSWFMDVEPYGDEDDHVYAYPYSSLEPYLHCIKYFNTAGILLNSYDTPVIEYPHDDNFPDYIEQHWDELPTDLYSISLSNMLSYLKEQYPSYNFDDNFLYQDIDCYFVGYDDNKVYYETTLNYSAVASDTLLPPADDSQPDWFQSVENISNLLNSNSYYYNELLKPPLSYVKPVYKDFSLDGLNTDLSFDYSFDVPDVDVQSVDFFAWLSSFIFNTPLGFVFLACLTMLVVEVILH